MQGRMVRWNWADWTAVTIAVIGALNWGLVGFFGFDLVRAIFGTGGAPTDVVSTASRVVFAIVGLAGLYSIYSMYKAGVMSAQRPARPAEERMRRAA